MAHAAGRLAALAETVLGSPLPVRIRAWDGSEVGPAQAPALVLRNPRALRRLLWRPGELGLARAWVAGDLEVDGDLYEALDLLSGTVWQRDEPTAGARKRSGAFTVAAALFDASVRRTAREALALAGPGLPPSAPPEEARGRIGARHSLRRDRQAISHHYDVGNDFYERVLGPSMVYSCAYWDEGAETLEDAQQAKLDLICRKLSLREGQRLLDVGCGWGSMVLHAAKRYGVRAVGVTLSVEQAAFARKRIAEEGLTDRVEIRVQDYREITDGPFDAISSIGMAEHVGTTQYRAYAKMLYGLLRPGGRLLNHQIARRPLQREESYEVDEFIDRYVFPDGELAPVGSTVALIEEAGFEVRDVEALREHYARTLRRWVANLEEHWDECVRLTSPGRARVWRLYMAASALSFERNRIGVNQILAVRTPASGESGMPPTRGAWLTPS
ncbi:cyclopropane-fatty-acyl-phospholipid synthase family protein [Streptomyces sp. RB6PN25]|uniref:Cyclopropane-fatty-acyl-phospholipid synthase family protein n=1 Tax=Streptomyces humicola TaxID=2953240 RepID=A0ABT1PS56_9ACTN|nr:cyclopropane-fatty-acyl-phospholipid synthase family protein [Streptomyces humicola]MCQ4080508.1 cyclopropane-fatty-acyl-phospholipid synthase family protein [Streptomyces humicola]